MGNLQVFGGGWTNQKLAILENYLKAYLRALKNMPFNLIYVDAFAGTGYREERETSVQKNHDGSLFRELLDEEVQQFHDGSVRIALDLKPRFHQYIFVEKNPEKVIELAKIKSENPEIPIRVVKEDANSFLLNFCNELDAEPFNRAVIFLDPFAMHVSWSTIEAIAKTEKVDLWYLFPISAVNRLMKNNPEKIPQSWKRKLDDAFGCINWFDEFYKKEIHSNLFGDEEIVKKDADTEKVSRFLVQRLKETFCGVAESPKVLRNSKNSPLFLLCFAASNPKGAKIAVKIAKHLLKEIENGRKFDN